VNVSYALIADIIRSRELPDRRRAQQVIYEALGRAAEGLALTQSPYATVGDELQAVSETLVEALALTLRMHLLLPEGLGLRFKPLALDATYMAPTYSGGKSSLWVTVGLSL